MLTFDDSESVMNAAGTMGTLVSEPSDGDLNFVACWGQNFYISWFTGFFFQI